MHKHAPQLGHIEQHKVVQYHYKFETKSKIPNFDYVVPPKNVQIILR